MAYEPGLHKKVSSIFDGVQIPGSQTDPFSDTTDSDAHGLNTPGPDTPGPDASGSDASGSEMSAQFQSEPQLSLTPREDTPRQRVQNTQPPQMQKTGTQPAQETPRSVPPDSYRSQETSYDVGQMPQSKSFASAAKLAGLLAVWDKIMAVIAPPSDDPEVARQRKMTSLVGFLGVVFACVLFFVLREPRDSRAGEFGNQLAGSVKSKQIEWVKPEPWPEDLRNPMTLDKRVMVDEQSDPFVNQDMFVITGIVQSTSGNHAIISNKILGEGDEINGAKVIKINPDSVEFETSEHRWTQPLRR